MVENELCRELRKFLADVVKDFLFETGQPGESPRPPQIIAGFLPPKRTNAADFPFIIVRPEKGTADREENKITVSLIVGCYSEEYNGYEYCMNVLSRVRGALFAMKDQTLAKKYRLEPPLTWELYSEQPYPQWELTITTDWSTGIPQTLLGWMV